MVEEGALIAGDVLRPLEHEVLEEVRETALSGPLVGRADVVPDVHPDDRSAVVLGEDDGEAVRQLILLERYAGNVGCGEEQCECEHGISRPRGIARPGAARKASIFYRAR